MGKKLMVTGLIGMIGTIMTAGVIGYVIGDNYGLDFELLGELLLVYIPPIVGSICTTLFIKSQCKENDVEKIEEAN